VSDTLLAQAAALSPLEATAVLLSLAYLVLAVREHRACWLAAMGATAIYLVVFWQVRLLMEAALQLFYLAMAVHGWRHWGAGSGAAAAPVVTWPVRAHALALGAIAVATVSSGAALTAWTDARLPYVDAFTTWGSVVTTVMVARKVLENWYYWLVIDSVSIGLYLDRGLLLTAALFVVYLVLVFFGIRAWTESSRRRTATA
jgi:nicotinamide mononucleotide transporter